MIDFKHTGINALNHSLVGWVMNTPRATVVGQLQGNTGNVRLMKKWLRETGSPKSRIERCEFKNERTITNLDFTTFTIRK